MKVTNQIVSQALCVSGVVVLLTLSQQFNVLRCQETTGLPSRQPIEEDSRPNQTRHVQNDVNFKDKETPRGRFSSNATTKSLCLTGGAEGGSCSHSAQCASSHFCHPERRSCAEFCRSTSYKTNEMDMRSCSQCIELCGRPTTCQGFIEERPQMRGGAGGCAKRLLVGTCPMCKEQCRNIQDAMPVKFPVDDPSEMDFWITSYPKTGSTWVRHLITNLYQASQGETKPASFKQVDDAIPFIEDGFGWNNKSMFRDRKGLRMWKSHSSFHCDTFPCKGETAHKQGPAQCMCPNCAAKFQRVVYVYRDGYDTLASYFRFRIGLGHVKDSKSFPTFANDRRMYPGVSWSDHIRSWQHAEAVQPNLKIHWLRYEAMEESPETELKRLADFLGIATTEANISFAINASSAKTMEDMEQREGGVSFFKLRYSRAHLKFVHAGTGELSTSNLWSSITEEALAIWQLHNGPMMRCLGYPELPPSD